MGIHSEFSFGIRLYDYSFAFSHLDNYEEKAEAIFSKTNNGFNYLASISRELFGGMFENAKKTKTKLINNWGVTCF